MSDFISGQKVLCINDNNARFIKRKMVYILKNPNTYNGDSADWVGILVNGTERLFSSYRFKTIIETIDDVLPGMKLTVVKQIDTDHEKFKYISSTVNVDCKQWPALVGEVLTIKRLYQHDWTGGKKYIEVEENSFLWPIELFEEYPGNVGYIKKKEAIKAYKIPESFNGFIRLSNIFERKPAGNCPTFNSEFLELLKKGKTSFDIEEIYLDLVTSRNIDWLLKVGLLEKIAPEFEPFEFKTKINNVKELLMFYHQFNCSLREDYDYGSYPSPGEFTLNKRLEIHRELKNHCDRLGLAK